jgi:hypothetical protein
VLCFGPLTPSKGLKNPGLGNVIDLDNEDTWRNAADDGPDSWTKVGYTRKKTFLYIDMTADQLFRSRARCQARAATPRLQHLRVHPPSAARLVGVGGAHRPVQATQKAARKFIGLRFVQQ